jgi:MFS transporter, YNFM family, putative membrane transport protein
MTRTELPWPQGFTKVIDKGGFTLRRSITVGAIGFLTLVDLFAAQAILPSLAKVYGVSPAAIGLAANAGTLGMAIACLAVAMVSRHLNRKLFIWISLTTLAIPTSLLSIAPNLVVFAILRILQGLCMATAFTLMMAYLSEHLTPNATARALAAYITGVVGSNIIGRLVAATVAELFGLAANFYLFAAMNLIGAVLVLSTLDRTPVLANTSMFARSPFATWDENLRNPELAASFGIGFLVLFAFIGTFTYVNFVLAREPLAIGIMSIGFAYLTFLPSMITTPIAGRFALRFGSRSAIWGGLGVAICGLPLVLLANIPAILLGMVLISIGTFFAQAVATGFVGRAGARDPATASGLYLASYYTGGLVGAALLGQLFDHFGWPACVAGIALSLLLAARLAAHLQLSPRPAAVAQAALTGVHPITRTLTTSE